jgi:hypothetical protein
VFSNRTWNGIGGLGDEINKARKDAGRLRIIGFRIHSASVLLPAGFRRFLPQNQGILRIFLREQGAQLGRVPHHWAGMCVFLCPI